MKKGRAMFDTMENLQAHYKAVRRRIEVGKSLPQKMPDENKPQAMPMVLMKKPAVIHSTSQKYKIENHCLVRDGRPGVDRLTYQQVVKLVCREFDLTPRLLFAPRRTRVLVEKRHLCWAIARVMCPHMSLPQIGRASYNYDHTSVLHGIERARERAKPYILALQRGELKVD
jgi:hypothetical protein